MKIRISLFALFVSLILASCSNESEEKQSNNNYLDIPVQFSSMISGEKIKTDPISRASNASWDKGDAIGVFMIKANEQVASQNIIDGADNTQYVTVNGNGQMTAADPSQSIFYPESGARVDFVAYYPYTASLTNYTLDVNILDQSKPENIDLLYSNNAKWQAADGSNPNLSFGHQLSAIQFKITAKGSTDIKGITATVIGMKTKASFALSNGILTIDNSSTANFNANTTIKGAETLIDVIVLPQAGENGRSVKFNIAGGKSYEWKIPATTAFTKGQKTIYNVTVGDDDVIVKPDHSWIEFPLYPAIANTQVILHDKLPGREHMRNCSMLYDTHYKMSYWVAYPLHSTHRGGSGRTNKWAFDPNITSSLQANMKGGLGGGYDRGHQMPSADRTFSKPENRTTFYYTNMTAQRGVKMNQSIWADLEEKVRAWIGTGTDTLYVVTGAMLTTNNDKNIEYHTDNDNKPIGKPKAYYKVLARKWQGTYYTIGFRIENKDYPDRDYMKYIVTVKDIEDETGFTFFPSLPASAKATVDRSKWN